MADLDLARIFTNAFPNTLDTTIQQAACMDQNSTTGCLPLSFVITGDINAMWLRDSANQLLPYLNYTTKDWRLKRLFVGLIYMQAHFINIDPYANAFNKPDSLDTLAEQHFLQKRAVFLPDGGIKLVSPPFLTLSDWLTCKQCTRENGKLIRLRLFLVSLINTGQRPEMTPLSIQAFGRTRSKR